MLLEQLIRGQAKSVTMAESGEEALEHLAAAAKSGEQFDMVITDLLMPGMNGDELADPSSDGKTASSLLYKRSTELKVTGCPQPR